MDSADKMRLDDCKKELHQLLQEEVSRMIHKFTVYSRYTRTPLMLSKGPWPKVHSTTGVHCKNTACFSCDCSDHGFLMACMWRLLGATLLVFANKQDLPGALSADEIKEASTDDTFCS